MLKFWIYLAMSKIIHIFTSLFKYELKKMAKMKKIEIYKAKIDGLYLVYEILYKKENNSKSIQELNVLKDLHDSIRNVEAAIRKQIETHK
jgi:hypothetical protein